MTLLVEPSLVAAASIRQVEPLLFFAFALVTCVSAWGVVVCGNIVRMSVCLLLTLAGAAGLYFILSAEFLAAVQLIVYVGGTLILIIFGVMLTSKNPFAQLRCQPWEILVGLLVSLSLGGLLIAALVKSPLDRKLHVTLHAPQAARAIDKGRLPEVVMQALAARQIDLSEAATVRKQAGQWQIQDGNLMVLVTTTDGDLNIQAGRTLGQSAGYDHVERLGRALLSTYLVPFEASAVLLLIVMIAAAYMARRRAGA